MTEPDQIEFHEHVGAGGGQQPGGGQGSRSMPVRIGIVAGSAVLLVVGAVAAMGASPAPSGSAASPGTGSGTKPNVPFDGSMPKLGPLGGAGLDGRGGGAGFMLGGFRDITIAAIDGSSLSLQTDDGWTRTIVVGSSTTIAKAGQTIALSDLEVGDQIVFGETKATDGSFTITAIRVILPVVGGQVSAVGTDSITVDQKGGASATIHVSPSTTYDVDGNRSAKLSDITVGSVVIAEGTKRSDGSLDASAVHAGMRGARGGGMGPMFHGGPNGENHRGAKPSASPSTSSGVG